MDEGQITALSSDKPRAVLAQILEMLEGLGEGFIQGYNNRIRQLAEKSGLTPKDVMMPLRLALTGSTHGPELVAVISLLGPEECKRRLKKLLTQTCGERSESMGQLNKNEINLLKET